MRVTVKQRAKATTRLKSTPYIAAARAGKPVAETGTDAQRYMTALDTAAAIDAEGSPFKFHADGGGTVVDLTPYRAAEAAFSAVRLPEGAIFNLGTGLPVKPVTGLGSVKSNGATIDGFTPSVDVPNSNIIFRPAVYAHMVGGDYNGLPPDSATEAHYNVVLAPGFREGLPAFPSNNAIRRSTFTGAEVGTRLEEAERVEAFGDAALKYAGKLQRSTLLGSLGGQWAGRNLTDDATGKFFLHDLFYAVDGSGSYVPLSDPAWNPFNTAGVRPALRTELLAFSAWPTTRDDYTTTVIVGRDAGVELVKSRDNTLGGYRAGSLGLDNAENSVWGAFALFMNVWGNGNAALGYASGYYHQTGDNNLYSGWQAGRTHVTGTGSIFVGPNAGTSYNQTTSAYSYTVGDWAVLLGQDAGRKTDGTTLADFSNRLYIQNRYTRNPLISGEFENGRVGINIPVGTALAGLLHIRDLSGNEGVVVDSSRRLILNHSASIAMNGLTSQLQTHGIAASTASAAIARWSTGQGGPTLSFAKSRGTTPGVFSIVSSGDVLGDIVFGGADGAAVVNGGRIRVLADGTLSSGVMPGRMQLAVSPAGSSTPSTIIDFTAATLGFFGVTPVAKPTLPAAGVVTAADIRTALISLGLAA